MSVLKKRVARLKGHKEGSDADDLRMVCFGAVVYGHVKDDIIRPIPVDFLVEGTTRPNIGFLTKCFERIASEDIEKIFREPKLITLLNQIFTKAKYNLVRSSVEAIEETGALGPDGFTDMTRPAHVFKIVPYELSYKDELFMGFKEDHGSFYAFHGTHMHSVRSIIENGLCTMFNQREVFGRGSYLASNINTTFSYYQFADNRYKGSRLGNKLAPVLMCEVIKHPKLEKSAVPGKPADFHVVPNTDWIRIDSLLLYDNSQNRYDNYRMSQPTRSFNLPNFRPLNLPSSSPFLSSSSSSSSS